MKKVGAKEICMTIVAIGVLACLLVYMLVYNDYTERTEALKASNAELAKQVEDLKVYYDNMELYQKSIKEMKAVIETITADYPGNALEEDTIMMAVDMQGSAVMNYEGINISENRVIHSIPADLVKGLKDENLQSDIRFRARSATYDLTTDYDNFKAAIAKVYSSPYRIGVNAVTFARDSAEDNHISGTIDITFYNLAGMNKPYNKPDMTDYIAGVTDLFAPLVTDEVVTE